MKESNEDSADVQYARFAKEWIESGATIVGGCCGTSPDTIAVLAESIKNASKIFNELQLCMHIFSFFFFQRITPELDFYKLRNFLGQETTKAYLLT